MQKYMHMLILWIGCIYLAEHTRVTIKIAKNSKTKALVLTFSV